MEIYSIIKNDGPGDILAWKFMGEDFNNNSQLIVSEAEEAVFIKDGVAVQVFDGGKYTLNSNNYPFISSLRNMMSAGVSPFNCKVYFINKAHRLELYWGTDSPIQLRDPVHRLQTSIRSRGSYSIQVTESKKFLIKLIGNNIQSFTKEELNQYFRSAFLMLIKDKIAQVIVDSGREILDIATEKTTIATALHSALNAVMDEYGVRVVNFYISDISIPEKDPNYEKLNKAYADRAVLGILGQDWGRQQAANILGDMANNPGAGGGVAVAGAGMGMGLAAGGAFGGLANQMLAPMAQNLQTPSPVSQPGQDGSRSAVQSDMANCPSCGAKNSSTAKFCNECGHKLLEGKIKCPNCSADMPETAKFCNECGTKM